MSTGSRVDPYLSFGFVVEIDSIVVAGFSEVSGLQVETEVHDYREGGLNDFVHRLPGPTRYPANLVLKHGVTDSDTLLRWHQDVAHGRVERKNGSVILRDLSGAEKRRWNFVQAYPVKWSGPDLRAGSSEVAVESLELVHQGITPG